MTDTMVASLATATQEENSAIKDFNGLVAAKTKQINALGKDIESKTSRIGQMGVELVFHSFPSIRRQVSHNHIPSHTRPNL